MSNSKWAIKYWTVMIVAFLLTPVYYVVITKYVAPAVKSYVLWLMRVL